MMYQLISVFHYTEITGWSLKQNVNICISDREYIRAFLTEKNTRVFLFEDQITSNQTHQKQQQQQKQKQNKTNQK